MFDSSLLFNTTAGGQVISADAYSEQALNIAKTPADGVWIEFSITAVTATVTAMTVYVLQKSANSGWDYTAAAQNLAVIAAPAVTAGTKFYVKVQSKLAYLKLYYDVTVSGGTFTVTAGIVSGPPQDAFV